MIAKIRFAIVMFVLGMVTIIWLPVQYVSVKFNFGLAKKIPLLWHRLALKLMGFKVVVKGEVPKSGAVMIIANHTSWTDIPVLGSIMELCFIAKQEVGEAPTTALLSRMQRTIFVKREAKRDVGQQVNEVQQRLLSGDTIVLFGEGSTGNGTIVTPFKSSLLGAAQYAVADGELEKVVIQPVSIGYTHLQGIPLGRFTRTKTAWYGDMDLGPHALFIMLSSSWTVEVTFGEPIEFDANSNRRELAKIAQTRVREMFIQSVHKPEDKALEPK